MNNGIKIILMVFACMLLSTGAIQIYNTLSFESQLSEEQYLNTWINTPEDQRPSNYYASYSANWRDHANVPSIIPLSILLLFFGFVGYMYYDDWKFEPQKEMFARYGGYHEL